MEYKTISQMFYQRMNKSLDEKIMFYKDRLKWANKKIIKLFPEYKPEPRRNKKLEDEREPEPLYQILENGDRVQIHFPLNNDGF